MTVIERQDYMDTEKIKELIEAYNRGDADTVMDMIASAGAYFRVILFRDFVRYTTKEGLQMDELEGYIMSELNKRMDNK